MTAALDAIGSIQQKRRIHRPRGTRVLGILDPDGPHHRAVERGRVVRGLVAVQLHRRNAGLCDDRAYDIDRVIHEHTHAHHTLRQTADDLRSAGRIDVTRALAPEHKSERVRSVPYGVERIGEPGDAANLDEHHENRDRGSGIGDPGSGIGDQGSGIRDRGSGIRDRGSGTIDPSGRIA